MRAQPATTLVYDSYWKFAAERLAIYYRRLSSPQGPWTLDPILHEYRFTNVFRASDRVSQYLIREVQYGEGRPQEPAEVYFRTLLFKIFNRIDTWRALEERLGRLSWKHTSLQAIEDALDEMLRSGRKIYSAAYIMPSPKFGRDRKHSNHLILLARMMAEDMPLRMARARSLRSVYEQLLQYPGVGSFLAFQYAIDLNYSSLMDFDESDFVVAGPGALDGISKCFVKGHSFSPGEIINMMVDRQFEEFSQRGLRFDGLFGRPLKPIDCQNIFCEISKYARAAYPEMVGAAGRTRIKQKYRGCIAEAIPLPMFPPKWNLNAQRSEPLFIEKTPELVQGELC
ncbi:hypothetical protein K4L06_17715 [Lysobacter sp. BMK333-48F3]|uniref:nucleotide kinase domain-containing protein n=1 Tax=Lysobacter sp. BMK333-48F3 TaxID=2867962 RepID=UPI001C8BFA63|nr:nucleotide kinase domain-containing protein [Lysobacter sp. BMK333-48F3]MBX9403150.1 hypothetical protein [Lysobacter sp. BMK333-48F3]